MSSRPFSLRTHPLIALLFGLCLLVSGLPGAHARGSGGNSGTRTSRAAADTPPPVDKLNAEQARYLLERTGFQPSEKEVAALLGMTREQAVDHLLAGAVLQAGTPPPDWVSEPAPSREMRNRFTAEEVRDRQRSRARRFDELRAWWLREMIVTPSPLTERMTLFWHNHFTSAQDKVRRPQLMYEQNVALRREALGNFGTMLHEQAKLPAMLLYLDGANSHKEHPNQNFAREVMDVYTLGPGHYSDTDVAQAARAFTGWSIDPDSMAFLWRPRIHDAGEKTVLGQSGDFDGDQVLDILLSRPETATLISAKVWREFVSPTPGDAELAPIADAFRASHYDIKVLLRHVFLSKAFWDERNRATLVKSPTEFVVGTARQFNLSYDSTQPFANAVHALGQTLFYPPDVKGWPGGSSWIDSTTLLARQQLIEQWTRASEGPRSAAEIAAYTASVNAMSARAQAEAARVRAASIRAGIRFDMNTWLAQFDLQPELQPSLPSELQLQKTVLQMPPFDPVAHGVTSAGYLRALLMDPTYQLK